MVFQSVEYLILLFVVFVFYWTVCRRSKNAQNLLIVLASSVFYGWWSWRFLGLLFLTAFSTFLAGYFMEIPFHPSQCKGKAIHRVNYPVFFY